MSATLRQSLSEFVSYCQKHLKGDEKGEAQIFLDRLFTAFGYAEGLKGAGAALEFRIQKENQRGTNFADLVWKPRVLFEMKKSGEKLEIHYQQAFGYWTRLVPDRPQYVVLCNFDEFWIYDFDVNIYEPLDKIPLERLPDHAEAFGFLLPSQEKPIFSLNRKDVTRDAAFQIAHTYKSLLQRKVDKTDALRFCLQCVVAMFAEDAELLPGLIFSKLVKECLDSKASSYELIGGLFREMNTPNRTPAGRYKDVEYFNGGIFQTVAPLELSDYELNCLWNATQYEWSNVNPAIFGSIFEAGMEKDARHILGAHYTSEQDIKKVVLPVITDPWLRRIEVAETLDDLYDLLRELRQFRVLDPACGSGNFLFIAYKEMKLLEQNMLARLRAASTSRDEAKRLSQFLQDEPYVSIRQFYGIDINEYAVELAKVTLMIAKELHVREAFDNKDAALPLDNLDANIVCADALFTDWPECEAIVGNPPYQSKNKMQQEFGVEYLNKLRTTYPDVNGRADFCVYWFWLAHRHLREGQYAGLVGTNTVRQNNSRESSLDYIVQNGGAIVNAVSSQDWSGEAAVYVSIVTWKKGDEPGPKILFTENPDKTLTRHELPHINSSLSLQVDVTSAKVLICNTQPKRVFQGQTHGHEGFLLPAKEAAAILQKHPHYAEVLRPFLIGDEMLSNFRAQPERFVIDFSGKDVIEAAAFKEVFKIIENKVFPDKKAKAEKQEAENREVLENNPKAKVNKHHINFFNSWWKLAYGREEMLAAIAKTSRFVAGGQVVKRPIFEFISSKINPNAQLIVFAFEDDYSFGVIQSSLHTQWFREKCSTLKGDFRYTTDSVWDTFPWPQSPTLAQVQAVAQAAKSLRALRRDYMEKGHLSLRDLYRTLDKPGKNPLRDAHTALDRAVLAAYGWADVQPDDVTEILTRLLALNLELAEKEANKEPVQAPGLPASANAGAFVSEDCVEWER
jgi:SAM-dependent methyltransferase